MRVYPTPLTGVVDSGVDDGTHLSHRLLKKQFFHRALKVMKKKPEKDPKKEKVKGDGGKEEEKKSKKEKEKEKKKDTEATESKKEKSVSVEVFILKYQEQLWSVSDGVLKPCLCLRVCVG